MTRTDANPAARRSGAEHLLHSEITASVIAAFFEVYRELKYGLGESLYAAAMEIALTGRGLAVRREAVIEVEFRGQKIGNYRADFVINATVVLELKAGAFLPPGSREQPLNYLRLSGLTVGLLLFFGPVPEFQRVVNTK